MPHSKIKMQKNIYAQTRVFFKSFSYPLKIDLEDLKSLPGLVEHTLTKYDFLEELFLKF